MSTLQKGMATRAQRLQKRRNINKSAILIVDRFIKKNFQQQGALTTTGGWKPLALRTIAARRKGKGKGKPQILRDNGWLEQKWVPFYSSDIAKTTSVARGIRSGVPYGIFHDQGTRRIPQRKITPHQKQVKPDIEKLYNAFIRRSIR
jgi:phage gpG-like protein